MSDNNETRQRIPMNPAERRAAGALASIVATRLFGLFLILPVFAAYARHMPGATPLMIGLALGIYGLTQGMLQIPFGWLSDRIGRRRVIALGVTLFIIGSVVAALATHIAGVIVGRALQGCGAIAGAAMALAADLSRDSQRSKMMAMIGTSVGGAFVLAMLAGPVLAGFWEMAGLFWISAALGAITLVLLYLFVPAPDHRTPAPSGGWRESLANGDVLQLCLGAMLLHAILTSLFVALPVELRATTALTVPEHWRLYLPALLIAGVVSVGAIIAGRESQANARLVAGVACLAAAPLAIGTGVEGIAWALISLTVFFTGFTLLEATLPALMSHQVSSERRGTAMGLYATGQFLGAFIGGAMGGWTMSQFGRPAVFWFSGLLGVVWLVMVLWRVAVMETGSLPTG